jgi:hypothetical protein
MAHRYNAPMRRLGLILAIVLLLVLFGAYTAFWFIVAGRIEDGAAQWAASARDQGIAASWSSILVGGYPLAFRVELRGATLRDEASNPPVELRAASLSAVARPWAFRVWRLAAPEGLNVIAGNAASPVARIGARAAEGAVSAGAEGGAAFWLTLHDATGEAPAEPFGKLAATTADLWLILPASPPQTHSERNVGVAADLRGLAVPVAAAFGGPIDDLAFGITMMGPIASGPPRQAAEAWRRAGGTAELDRIHLAWGGLRVSGSGTLALDEQLQPMVALSGSFSGVDQLMAALVAAGRMRAGDARLARVALTMLAKPGPDGKPEIATSFTIQNGEMYLGPAKLGPAPRINWP